MVIQQFVGGMIKMMLAKFILNDMPHAVGISSNPYNPGNPSTTSDIIRRTELKEYEYKWFPPPEEEKPPRMHPYTRTRNVGTYSVVMTRTDDTCTIKLYEFLEGWKKKLVATWTGIGKVECDKKLEQVVDTVIQVRFEEKTALGRLR